MRISEVQNKLDELYVELTYLKHIINGIDNKEDPQYNWLQKEESITRDHDEMQNQLLKLHQPHASTDQKGRVETDVKAIEDLNIKVTDGLAAIKALKEPAFETFLRDISEDKLKRYSHDDLTIDISKEIGSGAFSKVYKCQLSDGVQGAVKVLREKGDQKTDYFQDVFVIELSTMIKASHPNLIKLYGFCFDDNMKALVYEFMEKGSLDRALFTKDIMVEWQTLYDIALGVAKVLAYLHDECSDQIIHRDIKPANVLLDSNLSPKVTDFGVSKIMSRDVSHFTMTSIQGTSSYIAPEMIIHTSIVTYTCDVYSFGMMLFDILGTRINTKSQPSFPNHAWVNFDKGKLDEILKECKIMEKDKERATILTTIAFWCLQFTPEVRPSMKTVVTVLEKRLLVPKPPNPSYVSGAYFSIQQSPDGTYSMASHSRLPKEKLSKDTIDYRAYVKGWKEGTFEKNFVEVLPRSPIKEFSYEDLMSFTTKFSTKVSSDAHANFYKGEFPNGEQITVILMLRSSYDDYDSDNRFMIEQKKMSTISHPNIIKLYGFCSSRNYNAFFVECPVNGSLEKILFGNHPWSMDWAHLYCIAIEIAKGVSYLHNGFDGSIIHMQIKPSNIFLDSYLSPKITNFGLIMPKNLSITNYTRTQVRGDDYMPPEALMMSSPLTDRYDVFSFGIMLLEIFGRQRYKAGIWEKFEEGQVEELLREFGFTERNKQEALILLKVAFWCIQFTPKNRPPMRIVVKMLEKEIEVIKPPNPFQAQKLVE